MELDQLPGTRTLRDWVSNDIPTPSRFCLTKRKPQNIFKKTSVFGQKIYLLARSFFFTYLIIVYRHTQYYNSIIVKDIIEPHSKINQDKSH